MSEQHFEKELISYLCTGEISPPRSIDQMQAIEKASDYVYRTQLWKYEEHIKTTDQLWENFKKILEQHNHASLRQALSETEFSQVKKIISELRTPYEAGQFLYGLNGVSQIEVDLDDGRHVYLDVFNQKHIGAGDTVYQVVNQIERQPILAGRPRRVFDVTLLINGLPIIQIEEKMDTRDVNEALNQMHQYIEEKQYSGIYSTTQILVAMTQNNVKYMANTTSEMFNKDFAFHWQRWDNSIVRSWKDFADQFLSIPMAHQMSTNYMILDGTSNRQSLKVMRPYQVYATQKIINKLKHVDFDNAINKVGYVWHTTGSGKTITSFKSAWLASRLPNVDKVIFVVDRIQLTKQTSESYRAYDPEADMTMFSRLGSIADTENTNDLNRQLKSKGSNIIVTSVQKLNTLVSRKSFKLPDKNYVFIVDEAHRSTGGESFDLIQKAFKGAAWVGYTGTPMFDDTTRGLRTKDIFGPLLHAYTIREAIADQNVLGFKVDFQTTISEKEMRESYLPEYYRYHHPDWTNEEIQHKIDNLTVEDIDDTIEPSFYDNNEEHVKLVVEDIFKNWRNRSVDGKYNALFTTHVGGNRPRTPMAMMYFKEFQRINDERRVKGLSTLKVAITYSLNTSNSDYMVDSNNDLLQAMFIYNEEFGTSFGLADYAAYTQDVISRLQKTNTDGNFLDVVIVVDQLLTGFDAPQLNTLYVDRILRSHSLIQAYSRTNRIADLLTKPFGRIINYRWPSINENLMNEALAIYANKDSAMLSDEERKRYNEKDGIIAINFEELLLETQGLVNELRRLSNDINEWAPSEQDKENAFSILQAYNKNLEKLKQYDVKEGECLSISVGDEDILMEEGFDYDDPDTLIKALGMDVQEEKNLSTFLTNELKKFVAKKRDTPVYQLEFEMSHIKDVRVNYDYLSELLAKLMNEVYEQKADEAKETKGNIFSLADNHPDIQTANDIKTVADEIYNGLYIAEEYPVKDIDGLAVIQQVKENKIIKEIQQFFYKWGLIDLISAYELKEKFDVHTYGEREHFDRGQELTTLLRKASDSYKVLAADEDIQKLNKIKYRNALRSAIYELADHYVQKQ